MTILPRNVTPAKTSLGMQRPDGDPDLPRMAAELRRRAHPVTAVNAIPGERKVVIRAGRTRLTLTHPSASRCLRTACALSTILPSLFVADGVLVVLPHESEVVR